ncbi:MAG: hypothetical protein FJW39_24620 [Acidobacteria bacterium]|nr:hypothetical protein [Acidobacteriota bacterium]
MLYLTYLGGTSVEGVSTLQVDAAGNAYVGGDTRSANFPTTAGAPQRTFGGGTCAGNPCQDGFAAKLNPTATALVYSTLLGGSNVDWVQGIAIDAAGAAYVSGGSASSNFPVSNGAFQPRLNEPAPCAQQTSHQQITCGDSFVAKIAPDGQSLTYSTYLGGPGAIDTNKGIAVTPAGEAVLVGTTRATAFPLTANAIRRTPAHAGADRHLCHQAQCRRLPTGLEHLPGWVRQRSGGGGGCGSGRQRGAGGSDRFRRLSDQRGRAADRSGRAFRRHRDGHRSGRARVGVFDAVRRILVRRDFRDDGPAGRGSSGDG